MIPPSNTINTQSPLTLFSPAKINLFLHITDKRDDGYHNLQTVFRLLNWGDTLHFEQTTDYFNPQLPLTSTTPPVRLSLTNNLQLTQNPSDNLVVKAAVAMVDALSPSLAINRLPIIDIHLDKQLPTGAGLGGGSSNAATTLIALNRLWQLDLPLQTLIKIGTTIGADVPVFLWGTDAIAQGIGEQLSPIDLSGSTIEHYLLLNPSMKNPTAHASTAALFGAKELQRDCQPLNVDTIRACQSNYTGLLNAPFTNVFEPVVTKLVPAAKIALDYLTAIEPITQTTARMTGSGSSVFLPLYNDSLDQVQRYLEQHPAPCHHLITRTIE